MPAKLSERHFSRQRYDGRNFFNRRAQTFQIKTGATQTGVRVSEYTDVYEEDIGRIIYSSAFRRMQNKTQVHPRPSSDFVRNRLTHTIEISHVAKLISNAIGKHLKNEGQLPDDISFGDITNICVAASLTHDIGNPPFGHTGEDAIRSWFAVNKDRFPIVESAMSEIENADDFLLFDGNAFGMRVLTRLQGWRDQAGLRLSSTVLGAFSKYPFSSSHGRKLKNDGVYNSYKYGYMVDDSSSAILNFKNCGMKDKGSGAFTRHPLSYIVEASDDISYYVTDLVDGYRYGVLGFSQVELAMMNCSNEFHRKKYSDVTGDNNKIAYLSSAVVSTMADECFLNFVKEENLSRIDEGDFEGNLIEDSKYKDGIKEIKHLCSSKLYTNKAKIEIETGGHYIIDSLLESFIGMAQDIYDKKNGKIKDISQRSKNLYHLLPEENRYEYFKNHNAYRICCRILDHVAGMTDTYATYVHQKITGRS